MTEKKASGIPLGCVSDGGAYLPEREKVRELRMREMGCAEIAGRLGIPEGTVILHCLKLGLPATGPCRRIPLPKEDAAWLRYHRREPKYANCPVCGKKIIQPLIGRPKKFCSRTCKNKFWNDRWRAEKEKHGRRAVCENCGEIFYAVNEGKKPQRFCCQDCYFEFRYGRRE